MATTKNNITILRVKVKKWVIPLYGNKHTMPYGTLYVEISYKEHPFETMKYESFCVSTKGDTIHDKEGYQYVTINRQRYRVITESSMWNPKIELKPMRKEKINGKLCWVN